MVDRIVAHMAGVTHPLIAIMGTTGVGKSQLAVELALRLSTTLHKTTAIINADAMQTYSGLDIITNKMPVEERLGVSHRLLGFQAPGTDYKIGEWVKDALKEINTIHNDKGIPILVGGTSYWIQHLLLDSKLPAFQTAPIRQEGSSEITPGTLSSKIQEAVSELSKDLLALWNTLPAQSTFIGNDDDKCLALYHLLLKLDPPMAQRWHWRDARKVLRSLQIIRQTGRPASEFIAGQEEEGVYHPRFPSLVFWLYSRPEKLDPRLDVRVDQMLQRGLLGEIKDMRSMAAKIAEETRKPVHTLSTEGVFQSIGYREFDQYFAFSEQAQGQTHRQRQLFAEAVASMKHATRKYAGQQIKWMRKKMVPAAAAAKAAGVPIDIFVLDASDLGEWDKSVKEIATDLSLRFIQGAELPTPMSVSPIAQELLGSLQTAASPLTNLAKNRKFTCDVCTAYPSEGGDLKRPLMYRAGGEWEGHVNGRAHRAALRRRERAENPNKYVQMRMNKMMEDEKQEKGEAEVDLTDLDRMT